jgi:glycosyltransferase involved in cell wall biosynthesis
MPDDTHLRKFVLAEWSWSPANFRNASARTTDEEWLSRLSECNFFLACPGMIMPMCHNIIEAMAVGTIPITEYAEEFYPPLEHEKNCLVFKGSAEAKAMIEYALTLTPEQVKRMKENVIQYYEEHLSPESFIQRVRQADDQSILTMNGEQSSV